MGKIKSLLGNVYGRLIVISFSRLRNKRSLWICECSCGNTIEVSNKHLQQGSTNSCGCLHKEVTEDMHTKHGMSATRFYKIWMKISKSRYHKEYYEDVHTCNEWLDFINFKNEMHESYLEHVKIHSERNTTIDRLESNLGYCKNNCRWATWEVQNNNKEYLAPFKAISPNGDIYIENNGVRFAKEHNLEQTSVRRYLRLGSNKKYKGWHFEYDG